MNLPKRIKIVIVDDHQMVLESLGLLLSTVTYAEVVATFNDSRLVGKYLENNPVDIVVSDLHLPYLSGIDLTLQIHKNYPHIKVLLLTMSEDKIHIKEAIKAGVHGYVLKKAKKEELEKALATIANGRKYYSEDVIEVLIHTAEDDLNEAGPATILHLTGREIQILQLIAEEYSSHEIGTKLFISLTTVETHRRNLMQKLNVKNSVGLVKYAMRHGLIPF